MPTNCHDSEYCNCAKYFSSESVTIGLQQDKMCVNQWFQPKKESLLFLVCFMLVWFVLVVF